MAWNFNFSLGRQYAPIEIDSGTQRINYFHSILDLFTKGNFKDEQQKLETVLSNPACLKVLTFIADTYSQVKIDEWKGDKLVLKDFLYSVQKTPNDWQTWTDLHWDVSFWRSLGNAYIYKQNDVVYCLNPFGIELTSNQNKKLQQLTFSKYGENSRRNILKGSFKYRNANGENSTLELKNVYVLNDLSGGISGNWFKGNSRLDSLYQVVKNSELALQSKGINLDFSGKFFANGQYNGSTDTRPMGEDEQKSIQDKLLSKLKVFATKSKVDIKQLVSNLKDLKLDEAYIADLTIIGNMYGLSKDVLDVVAKGSTFENKEKSVGSFVDYTLMPKVVQHTDLYEVLFEKEDLRGSFKHLPFNAVFEADKINNKKVEIETLKIAVELGLDEKLKQSKLKEIYGS